MAERTWELLERVGAVLRGAARQAGQAHGLQPVHLQVLRYLERCNRYSDTPAALTEFLGLTKGTVSQSVGLLERKGLVGKASDPADGRKVRLALTPAGRKLARDPGGAGLLGDALGTLPAAERAQLEATLEQLLRALQQAQGGRAFGVCRTCQHHEALSGGRGRCGLTGEPLSAADGGRICREHAHP